MKPKQTGGALKEYNDKEEDEDILKYFVDGYACNDKYLRIVPSRKYLSNPTKIKWVTLMKIILRPTRSLHVAKKMIYSKTFKKTIIHVETRRMKDLLFIEQVKLDVQQPQQQNKQELQTLQTTSVSVPKKV